MGKKQNKTIKIQETLISWKKIENETYICLTDMARTANPERTEVPVLSWMRNRNTVEFIAIWERFNNPDFNPHGFVRISQQVGLNNFYLSPKNGLKRQMPLAYLLRQGVTEVLMPMKILPLNLHPG